MIIAQNIIQQNGCRCALDEEWATITSMRIPQRRSQSQKIRTDSRSGYYVTEEGLRRLEQECRRLKRDRPALADEVARLAQLGDFSENAEYQEAKHHLRRLNDRLLVLEDRIKNAALIRKENGGNERVALGSTVVIEKDGKRQTFQLVGPQETDPSRGRISHVSPLGAMLMGGCAGETVRLQTPAGASAYLIVSVA